MLIDLLRQETTGAHQELDAFMSAFLQKMTDRESYSALLAAFYGFIQPLKKLIDAHIDQKLIPEFEARRGAGQLLVDLRSLGMEELPQLSGDLPRISSHESALGALYVLEGSTLGGKIISKRLKEGLGDDIPTNFYSSYGPETGRMWKEFVSCLEMPANNNDPLQTAEAAKQTFSYFAAWLKVKLPIEQ